VGLYILGESLVELVSAKREGFIFYSRVSWLGRVRVQKISLLFEGKL